MAETYRKAGEGGPEKGGRESVQKGIGTASRRSGWKQIGGIEGGIDEDG